MPVKAQSETAPMFSRKTTTDTKDPTKPGAGESAAETEEAPQTDPYAYIQSERWCIIFWQMLAVFFVTGSGSIGTGVVLTHISKSMAFLRVKDLYLLMPVLQGFKGNVDACLGARLSTQANLGNLNTKSALAVQITSNIALTQVQCVVGAMIISIYSVALGSIVNRDWNYKHAILLTMAATITNTITSFFLDLALIGLILLSKRYNINPDNVICPIAATAAELITLVFFSTLVNVSFHLHHTLWWFLIIIIIVIVFTILPVGIVYSLKVPETKSVLFRGWYVLLIALVLSCLGSLVLDAVVDHYRGYILFQPVLNSTTGNFATILCTRLSTMLYQTSSTGAFHPRVKLCVSPLKVLFRGTPQAKCVRLLMLIGVPGQVLFVFLADYIFTRGSSIRPVFVFSYIFVSALHMVSLMYVSHLVVHALWKFKIDPDNAAIPIVSAVGDFLGSSLLATAFAILIFFQQEYLHGLFGDNLHGISTHKPIYDYL